MKIGRFEDVTAFIEEDHQRSGIGRKCEDCGVLFLGYRDGGKFWSGGGGDFDFGGNMEEADTAFYFLRLFNR